MNRFSDSRKKETTSWMVYRGHSISHSLLSTNKIKGYSLDALNISLAREGNPQFCRNLLGLCG